MCHTQLTITGLYKRPSPTRQTKVLKIELPPQSVPKKYLVGGSHDVEIV